MKIVIMEVLVPSKFDYGNLITALNKALQDQYHLRGVDYNVQVMGSFEHKRQDDNEHETKTIDFKK